jgi:hypothetical protein
MGFLSDVAPLWFIAFLVWNLGFWSRFIVWSRAANLDTKKRMLVFLGVPISRMQQDISGAMFQIDAYLLSVAACVLGVLVQDKVSRLWVFLLLTLPSIWVALGLVRLLIRKKTF